MFIANRLPNTGRDAKSCSIAEEIFTGTAPNDPDSVFAVELNGNTLSWPFASGLRYGIMGCTNLIDGNWFFVDAVNTSNYVDDAAYDALFYSIEAMEDN